MNGKGIAERAIVAAVVMALLYGGSLALDVSADAFRLIVVYYPMTMLVGAFLFGMFARSISDSLVSIYRTVRGRRCKPGHCTCPRGCVAMTMEPEQ